MLACRAVALMRLSALQHELDLGPAAAGRGVDRGAAAVALHPPDDRLAHAAPVGRHGGRIEARPAVAHEDLQALAAGLRVDRNRARVAGELRRVEHRLARRRDERLAVAVERRVADGDDVDRDAVRLLDLVRRRLQRRRQPALAVGGAGAPLSQVRSSRSWRRASAATSRGSSARFCMSASVCRTESCRCAATSARSCERIRSARSADSDVSSRTKNGAKITPSAIATTTAASATSVAAASAPVNCRNTTPPRRRASRRSRSAR